MEEHQTPPSILPLPLEELVPLLQAWLQARLPEGERKPGRPRTFSDLSLFLFHLVRALLGFSSERMRRELARNPRLRKRLGLERVPSSATLSERSRKLPWPLLRGGKRVGRGRRVLAMDATLLPAQRSDGEAAWGVGSDGGWVYGYKLHLLVDLDTGEVLALRVTPASWHDSPVGRGMLWGVERFPGEKPPVVVADAAYEGEANFRLTRRRGMLLVTGHNRRRGRPRPRVGGPKGSREPRIGFAPGPEGGAGAGGLPGPGPCVPGSPVAPRPGPCRRWTGR
ncbi:transposase [Thermus scotoductus]|uniref:Transposase n=1 Tax=Thermus scotoductus TaxID=37636 RepID=A0A430S2F1_THESC|nr:transposase [Thermus scotoductus]RTH27912.1 transposase [Thermus scotoductus]